MLQNSHYEWDIQQKKLKGDLIIMIAKLRKVQKTPFLAPSQMKIKNNNHKV
jgi:hypothetical protein